MRYFLLFLALSCAMALRTDAAAERMFYMSEGKVLQGCVYKPRGEGPFPAIIFNQNSSKPLDESGGVDPFPELGKLFTANGYVLFLPGRHKDKEMEDDDERSNSGDLGNKPVELAQAYLQDITTAMLSLKAQSFVDPNRIVAMGTCAGGTATLLLAQQNMDLRGYVVFSPASGNWRRSVQVQEALKAAARSTEGPIFLIQPENDFSLEPIQILGPLITAKGKPNKTKVYPAFGKKQKDVRGFGTTGTEVWGKDVLAFIEKLMR